MEAPKCKVCGERHYGMCQSTILHIDPVDSPLGKLAAKQPKTRHMPPEMKAMLTGKLKFDREAYQRDYMREYMRKRRAKAKGQHPPTE